MIMNKYDHDTSTIFLFYPLIKKLFNNCPPDFNTTSILLFSTFLCFFSKKIVRHTLHPIPMWYATQGVSVANRGQQISMSDLISI